MDNMNPTKELNMAITATFAINASDELRARLKDDDELVDFVCKELLQEQRPDASESRDSASGHRAKYRGRLPDADVLHEGVW